MVSLEFFVRVWQPQKWSRKKRGPLGETARYTSCWAVGKQNDVGVDVKVKQAAAGLISRS